ncbi:MAG: methyltransferase, partial [Spirochaetales bacterium]|nr:methyltransferase [Spirochaetales bacterium]
PLAGIDEKDDFSDLDVYMKKNAWVYMSDPLWKNADRPDFFNLLKNKAASLSAETDRAVMIGFGGNLFENGQFLYRTDEFFIKLLIESENMDKMLDKLLEMHMETLDKVLDAVGNSVDIIMFGDDLGTQSAPMIDPDLYRKVFYPRHKKMFQMVKDRTNMKVFLHSCGSIQPFLPDLIDAGVDIINPVHISAKDMDPMDLKKKFGKDLVFWGGGVDTQHVLPSSTPDEIRKDVRKNSEILMKDGGFVFNQVHNIVTGVPPENIVAMYEEANSIRY